ncbi:MAG: hypothetical protein AUJ11_00160 [Parcubacteria group bacterium CG1_02_44_65]|nr:MAG: hypothetical protein AUJ11_00160 [Parcubacteria group bacterium CG1_02_44_65]
MIGVKLLRKIKNNRGVSLLELVVAISIFSFLMLSSVQIFKMVVDGQRNAVSAQNVQENIRYAMEKISKEIRMAQASDAACEPAAVYKVFNTTAGSSALHFKNQDGQCLTYYLEDNRLKLIVANGLEVIADGFVTPGALEVSNLKFYLDDDLIGAFHSKQPYVTMVMDVKAIGLAINEQKMKIQITVSSRYYE